MSTSILPDGSVVVRLTSSQTVHLDVRTRAIHLRAASARDELGGSILESFPQSAIDRVRLIRAPDNLHHLFLELRSGRALSLGQSPTHEMAMLTARVVADLTRCKVEVSQGTVAGLPGPSAAFSSNITLEQNVVGIAALATKPDPFEEPTGRLPYGVTSLDPATVPETKVDVAASPLSEAARLLEHTPLPKIYGGDDSTTEPPAGPQPPRPASIKRIVPDGTQPDPPAVEPEEEESESPTISPWDDVADDDDPLDATACRPASSEERVLRVDTSDLFVPPSPRIVKTPADELSQKIALRRDDSPVSSPSLAPPHKMRILKARTVRDDEDSWVSLEEEREPTMEDAFDMSVSSWGEALPEVDREEDSTD